MLAFGFVTPPLTSGQHDPAKARFALYDPARNLAGEISRGAVRWSADSAHLDNEILRVASDVEDARDDQASSIGLPALDVPLRITRIPGGTPSLTADAVMHRHLANQDAPAADTTTFVQQVIGAESAQATQHPATSPPRAAETAPLTSTERFTTPSGDEYIPRLIGGHHDVLFVRRAIETGMTIALVGEPGSGKTTLAQVADPNLVTLNCHDETTVESIVGQFNPDPLSPTGLTWHDGPLLRAMKEGRPLLADEIVRAPQGVQAILLSVCDHRRTYSDESNQFIGTVTAADGFAVIVTYNPDSGNGMLEALADRIAVTVEVPTLFSTAEKAGVPAPLVHAARGLHAKALQAKTRSTATVWVPSLRSLLESRAIAAEFGIRFAAQALVSRCPEEQRTQPQEEFASALGVDVAAVCPLQALP